MAQNIVEMSIKFRHCKKSSLFSETEQFGALTKLSFEMTQLFYELSKKNMEFTQIVEELMKWHVDELTAEKIRNNKLLNIEAYALFGRLYPFNQNPNEISEETSTTSKQSKEYFETHITTYFRNV